MHFDEIPEHLFALGIVAVLALYYGFLSLDVWE